MVTWIFSNVFLVFALGCAAVSTALLVWYLVRRPPLTRTTKIVLLFGIGILFFDGRSFAGRFLTGAGALFIITGIIANMDLHFRQTSLFNTLVMLILLVGGLGLVVRSVMPMERKSRRGRDDDDHE